MIAAEDVGIEMTFGDGRTITIPRPDLTLRTDIWIEAFDGTYRLFLPPPQIRELEAKCSYVHKDGSTRPMGIFAIYGSIARGRYELEGKSVGFAAEGVATLAECRETVRLALIGGGMAVVDREVVEVGSQEAKRLVENYLQSAPVEDSWNMAFAVLHAAVIGRTQRSDEVGTSSVKGVPPPASLGIVSELVFKVEADGTVEG